MFPSFIVIAYGVETRIVSTSWRTFKENVPPQTPPEIKVLKDDASGITLEANIFGANVEELRIVDCGLKGQKHLNSLVSQSTNINSHKRQ